MQDSFKVARWEIKKMIRSKTFLVLTFLIPVLMLLIGGVVGYFSSRNTAPETLTIGVIDRSGILLDEIKAGFAKKNYEVRVIKDNQSKNYSQIIKEDKLDGILVIPAEVLSENQVDYYFTDIGGMEKNALSRILNPIITDRRLRAKGYLPEEIYPLIRNVEINARTLVGNETGAGPGSMGNMFLPLGLTMLMVFASMFSGGTLMQSIIKEKSNRIVELILSSISANSLMTGKVIGYGVLGSIQITIWGVSAFLLANYFLDISILPLLNIKTVYMLIYFFLGFILTASINAIVGAGMKEAQAGTQSTGLLVIIPIIPVYFASAIVSNPGGTIARILSFIPFTTPTTMLLRLGFSTPPAWEIGFTILILLITNYLLVKLAAKIFRVGMLMYGKNASFRELIRWARS